MSSLAQRRARLLRVRHVQHLQAVGEAATAEARLVQLEGNVARLGHLREGLTPAIGRTTGATLGHAGELATRLDTARVGLVQAVDGARIVATERAGERLDTHIARESAAKLQVRAVAEMQREIERRMMAAHRPRPARKP